MDADDKGSGLVDPIDGALDQNTTEVIEELTSGPNLEADVVSSANPTESITLTIASAFEPTIQSSGPRRSARLRRVKRNLSPSLQGKTHVSDRPSVN